MGKRRLISLSMGCVVVALFIVVSLTESAQVPPLPPNAEGFTTRIRLAFSRPIWNRR